MILWKPTTSKDRDDDSDSEDRSRRPRLLARAYAVFAAEQVDRADEIIARRAQHLAERDTPERIAVAESYFAAVPATVPCEVSTLATSAAVRCRASDMAITPRSTTASSRQR